MVAPDMRHVMYVTGTRADFGLMESTLRTIHDHPALRLSIAITGMHLDPQFGGTGQSVRDTGLPIAGEVPTPVGERSGVAMAHAVGHGIVGLANLMAQDRPDIVLLLGDRGEMLAGATAALYSGIPVAHIHGGDRSGTVDEPVRHAITKLSHFHFVATEESQQRVIRMGEREEFVWLTGGPSLDGITDGLPETRAQVCDMLALETDVPLILALFHPATAEPQEAFRQTQNLLAALTDTELIGPRHIIWLDPNADAGSEQVLAALSNASDSIHRYTHLARIDYLAVLKHCDVLIGNSSSGIVEAASFGTPVVNIGSRQNLRQRNRNTLDCAVEAEDIKSALMCALVQGGFPVENVYGDGNAGHRIADLLTRVPIGKDVPEKFNAY